MVNYGGKINICSKQKFRIHFSSLSCKSHTHLSHPPLLPHRYNICEEKKKPLSSSLCSPLHRPAISSNLCLNFLLSILVSNILSLCSSLNVRRQFSHPNKTKPDQDSYLYIVKYITSRATQVDETNSYKISVRNPVDKRPFQRHIVRKAMLQQIWMKSGASELDSTSSAQD